MSENQPDVTASSATVRPTKKQKELLAFIEQFITQHGYSPSYREIMNGLSYTSVATVALHVANLIKRGHLRKRDHSARSLEIVQPSEASALLALPTNQVKPSEEKWLVERVEQYVSEAEATARPSEEQLNNLYILVSSLQILGAEAAAHSFIQRLTALKKRSAE